MSNGLQVGFSYTYSHALDEQSALGFFYNGNNPNNLRDGYASADFDRTHVINFNYLYQLPKFFNENLIAARAVNGVGNPGSDRFAERTPYSIIDYSGAVGSVLCGAPTVLQTPLFRWLPDVHRRSRRPERPVHSLRWWEARAAGLLLHTAIARPGLAE